MKSSRWRTLNAEDHGGDSIPAEMVILRQPTEPDWWKAKAITEDLTVNAEQRLVVACLTELSAKTAQPKTDEGSADIKFDVYLRELQERSEERRVGKECVSTCRSRWSPYH